MRIPDELYEYIDHFPRHLIIPHRLMAYPSTVSHALNQLSAKSNLMHRY